jgi:hypothetical protein
MLYGVISCSQASAGRQLPGMEIGELPSRCGRQPQQMNLRNQVDRYLV